MICSSISELIGFECHPLTDDGSVAMIDTPCAFQDGDEIPVFVEKMAGKVRFLDGGGTMMHLLGRGCAWTTIERLSSFRTWPSLTGCP